MFTQRPLVSTIAYLRFPLRPEHRGRLCDGTACPHCDRTRIQKWGRFSGRQRFRCRDCRRTFSLFTGTPLRYLKRVERWRAFLWCMEGRLTLRRTGVMVGIDKNTALRWRHRVLDHWRIEPHRRLRGSIAVGAFRLPLNEKGCRRLGRRPRRHGHAPGRTNPDPERIGLIAAIETDAGDAPGWWIGCTDLRVPSRSAYEDLLGPRLGFVQEMVADGGSLSALARFAGGAGVAYRREQRGCRRESVARLGCELRRWLRPLRGVATHRLDNYLEWFRRDGIGAVVADGWRTLASTHPADRARRVREQSQKGTGATRSTARPGARSASDRRCRQLDAVDECAVQR